MKMFAPETYATFTRTLKALRARGVRPTLVEMGWAADYALALEAGDEDEARAMAERLGLAHDDDEVVVEGEPTGS